MATTKNGIYYQDNYTAVADVPEDLKKLAESVDNFADNIQQEQATQNQKILNNSNNLDLVADQLGETEQGFLQYKLENNQRVTYAEQNIIDLQGRERLNKEKIETLQQEVQELEQDVKANALEEETEQAKSLKITDASGARGKLKVFGNDEQETREGKNLWNDTSIENKKFSELTNTQVSTSNLALTEGDYCFKLFFTDGTYMQTNISIQLKNAKNTTLKTISNQSSVTLTAEEAKQIVSGVCWTNSTELADYANKTIAGLMLVKGTTLTDGYEKYGASPSLDYPSAIKSLGSNINLYPGWEKNTISSETGEPEIDPNYIRSVDFISVLPNKNYTIKAYNIEEFGDLNTAVRMYDINKNYLSSKWIGSIISNSLTFTLTNADVRYVKIVSSNNSAVTDTAKVDIKLEEGEVATTYSPFGQGSTEIRHFNTNFLNTENINKTISGVNIESNTDKSLKITGTATADGYESIYNKITLPFVLKQGTKVYLNFGKDKQLLKDTNVTPFAWFYSEDSTNTGNINKSGSYVATVSKDTTMLTFGIENIVNAKVYDENMYIVLSTENVEEYVENKNDSYILNIQQEMLRGDYFDLERKKEVHNWNKKIWNGTENWTVDSQNTNDTYISFKTQIDDMISLNSQNTQLIADKIINEYGGIALNKEHLWVYGIYIEVCVKKERLETLDATGFNKLLAQNNINIFYKLATPTELDLTEAQIKALEQLNKLRFYEGVNNILTTEDIALLQAIYPVNLKNVNNKMQEEIDEIKELLSTTQTSAMLLDNLEQDLIKEVE